MMDCNNFIRVYDTSLRTNPVFWNMAINCTDAENGQLVNFGPIEKKGIKAADEQIQELIEIGAIKHISNDLYQVSPFIIGKGKLEDICELQEKYEI